MRKITDLIGNEIVNVNTTALYGEIESVIFDRKLKKLCFYKVYTPEESVYLRTKKVKIGENTHFVNGKVKTEVVSKNYLEYPIFARIIDTDGRDLGLVTDITVDSDTLEVEKIIGDKSEFYSYEVATASNSYVIIQGKRELFFKKGNGFAKKQSAQSDASASEGEFMKGEEFVNEVLTKAFYNLDVAEEATAAITEDSLNNTNSVEERSKKGYSFLLGRKVKSPIYLDGQLLIGEGTVINSTIVARAHLNGKLKELIRFSGNY